MGNSCSGISSQRSLEVNITPQAPLISEEGHVDKLGFQERNLNQSNFYLGRLESLVQEIKIQKTLPKDETTDNTSIILQVSGSQLMSKMKSNQGSKLTGLVGSSESLGRLLNKPISNQSFENKSKNKSKKLSRIQTEIDKKYELFENMVQRCQTMIENDSFHSFQSFHSQEELKQEPISVLDEGLRLRCHSQMVVAVKGILKKDLRYIGNSNNLLNTSNNNKKVQFTGLENHQEKRKKPKYKKELEAVGFRVNRNKNLHVKIDPTKQAQHKVDEKSPSSIQKYTIKDLTNKRQSRSSLTSAKSPSGKKAGTPQKRDSQQHLQKSKFH